MTRPYNKIVDNRGHMVTIAPCRPGSRCVKPCVVVSGRGRAFHLNPDQTRDVINALRGFMEEHL